MKKTILLAGLVALMSSYTAFAGHEGGGGDAVIEADTLVLRDFVDTAAPVRIKNNLEFLKGIPDFEKLIQDIAKVNGEFAAAILTDLYTASIYKFSTSLPVLPSSQTTLPAGRKAEVQLAVRTGSEILIGKDFNRTDSTQYLMVHEALHGLLKQNSGPLHHSRVRTIVRYLKENRKTMTAEDLNSVLEQNYYKPKESTSSEEFATLLNKKTSTNLFCILINMNFAFGQNQTSAMLQAYQEIKCPTNYHSNDFYRNPRREYIRESFPELDNAWEAYSKAYSDLANNDIYFTDTYESTFYEMRLPKTRWWDKKEIKFQKERCQEYFESSNNKVNQLLLITTYLNAESQFNKILEESIDSSSGYVQKILLNYNFHDDKSYESKKKDFEKKRSNIELSFKNVEENRQVHNQNLATCSAKFPDLK